MVARSSAEQVDGNLTLNENIADNGGLPAALWGYRKSRQRRGPEPRLPGLENFTHDQLFFLAFANMWCEGRSAQSLRWALEDEHSPNHVRVMGTISNSLEFSEIWGCSSSQDAQHKCSLW